MTSNANRRLSPAALASMVTTAEGGFDSWTAKVDVQAASPFAPDAGSCDAMEIVLEAPVASTAPSESLEAEAALRAQQPPPQGLAADDPVMRLDSQLRSLAAGGAAWSSSSRVMRIGPANGPSRLTWASGAPFGVVNGRWVLLDSSVLHRARTIQAQLSAMGSVSAAESDFVSTLRRLGMVGALVATWSIAEVNAWSNV